MPKPRKIFLKSKYSSKCDRIAGEPNVYSDDSLALWEKQWLDKTVQKGTVHLVLMIVIFVVTSSEVLVQNQLRINDGCIPIWTEQQMRLRIILEGAILIMSFIPIYRLYRNPSWALYRCAVVACYVYHIFFMFPPFVTKCRRCVEVYVDLQNAASHCQKDRLMVKNWILDGQCATEERRMLSMLIAWIFGTSIVLPFHRMMWWNWFYIFLIYMPANFIYYAFFEQELLNATTCCAIGMRLILLSVCHVIASRRKRRLEDSDKGRFFYHVQEAAQTKAMFHVLADMVPKFTIVPLMTRAPGEVYAKPANCVSVLFIMLEDFNQKVRSPTWPPQALLEFLNQIFANWDTICNEEKVMKIETIGEEYVCAVGVDPEEQKMEKKTGHAQLLQRLVNAAIEILRGQTAEIKIKMGIHTGNLFTGVIGLKLPRFRLFGDTMNTAARMMQKAPSGKLQFGEETWQHFPSDLPSDVEVNERKGVYMKGKGEIDVRVLSLAATSVVPSSTDLSWPSEYDKKEAKTQNSDTTRGKAMSALQFAVYMHAKRAMASDHALIKLHQDGHRSGNSEDDSTCKEKQNDQEFEELVELVTKGGDVRSKPSLKCVLTFGLQRRFTKEMEKEWRLWHHQGIFFPSIVTRLDRHQSNILVLTAADIFVFVVRFNGLNVPFAMHAIYNGAQEARLYVFILSRMCCYFLLWFWKDVIMDRATLEENSKDNEANDENVQESSKSSRVFIEQFGLLCSYMFIYVIFYISYDSISTANWDWLETVRVVDGKPLSVDGYMDAMKIHGSVVDNICTPSFAVCGIVLASNHPWLFFYGLLFISCNILVHLVAHWLWVTNEEGAISLVSVYYTQSDMIVLLCFSGIVLLHIAYMTEMKSRESFLALKRLTSTRTTLDSILVRLAPPNIIEEMWETPPSAPLPSHIYKAATVAQSDLTGFTQLASNKTPEEVVRLISDLFGRFDKLTDKRGVWKVETVGDAYIAAMAERPLTSRNCAFDVVLFGQDMIRAVHQWAFDHNLPDVTCRVGVDHGTCIGGIVGTTCQRYHLFGGLMTVLEVLESTSLPSMVQISRACMTKVTQEVEQDGPLDNELEVIAFHERRDPKLTTSKGEAHGYEEVGGRTFFVQYVDALPPMPVLPKELHRTSIERSR